MNSKVASAEKTQSPSNKYCDSLINLESAKSSNQYNKKKTNPEQNLVLSGVVVPSLWWAKEQFDPFGGRLIDDWIENNNYKQIDLTVNWQLWTLLDYLDRYRFINQLGTVAREYDYELRIINQQKQCLATYQKSARNPQKWEINLDSLGQDSFKVEPSN